MHIWRRIFLLRNWSEFKWCSVDLNGTSISGFSSGHVWIWELDCEESWAPKNWCFWTVVLEKTLWRVPWTAGRSKQSILKEISPGCSLEGMMLKLKLQSLATWCEELTHWKRLWCWEGLGAGGEGDVRGWDGWMASLTRWMWVWVNSGSWCWTGRPGVLRFMRSQRVGYDWVTELNWTEHLWNLPDYCRSLMSFNLALIS